MSLIILNIAFVSSPNGSGNLLVALQMCMDLIVTIYIYKYIIICHGCVFQCALHNMLSTTVDARVRSDEAACNQLSQYRAQRVPRALRASRARVDGDVEILDQSALYVPLLLDYNQLRSCSYARYPLPKRTATTKLYPRSSR